MGLESQTRCIETQRYLHHPDGGFQIKVHVNPENPLGGTAFAIDAVWNGRVGAGGAGTEVEITVTLECKKRLWGGYGNSMVEGMLEKTARAEYEKWMQAAQRALEERKRALASSSSSSLSSSSSSLAAGTKDEPLDVRLNLAADALPPPPPPRQAAPSIFNRHALRYRVSTMGHGLVRGTERIVNALYDGDESEEREALIHVPIGTGTLGLPGNVAVFYHEGRYVPPRRRPRWLLIGSIVLGMVVLIALLYHYKYGIGSP